MATKKQTLMTLIQLTYQLIEKEIHKTMISEYYNPFCTEHAVHHGPTASRLLPCVAKFAPAPQLDERCGCRGAFHEQGCPQTAAIDEKRRILTSNPYTQLDEGQQVRKVSMSMDELYESIGYESPKPWRVDHDGPSRPIISTSDGRWLSLSQFELGRWISYEQEEQDAALIVNAVNTYPAVKGLVEVLEAAISYLEDDSRSERRRQACLSDFRAALATATRLEGK